MPSLTTHYGLYTFDNLAAPSGDKGQTFQTFRTLTAGVATNSNMNVIDGILYNLSGSITTIDARKPVVLLDMVLQIDDITYFATATGVSAYDAGTTIIGVPDANNKGTVEIDINLLGSQRIYKYDAGGNPINLSANDLMANRAYMFVYDGTNFVWVNPNSADQISISGSPNEIVIVSGSGLTNSGFLLSQIPNASGSYVVLSLNSSLNNEWLLTAGSGITIAQNASASTVTITSDAHTGSYVTLSLTPNLPNEWLLTAGSGITIAQNSSASTVTISSTAVTGSYVTLSLTPNLPNEWLLSAGSGISVTQNASASTVTISSDIVTGSYVTLSLNPSLTNEWLLTAGSGVLIYQNASASTVSLTAGSYVPNLAYTTAGNFIKANATGTAWVSASTVTDLNFDLPTLIAVDTGSLVVTQTFHRLNPETGLTDNIEAINGMNEGQFAVFKAESPTQTLTFIHGTKNISCFGAGDIELSTGVAMAVRSGSVVYLSGGGGGGGHIIQSAGSTLAQEPVLHFINNEIVDSSGSTVVRNWNKHNQEIVTGTTVEIASTESAVFVGGYTVTGTLQVNGKLVVL